MCRSTDGNAVDFAFDIYTGSAPYRAAAQGWQGEVSVLKEAVEELAEAMERAADEYDAADARAQNRMPRGAQ